MTSDAELQRNREKVRWWIGTVPIASFVEKQGTDEFTIPDWIGYSRGQKEQGAETGYIHVQMVVWCKKPQRLFRLRSWLPGHWEPTKSSAALSYVWKEDTRIEGSQFEAGVFPVKRNSTVDWKEIKCLAIKGELDSIPEDIYIRYYSTFKSIARDHMQPLAVDRSCFLFVGNTGTGKSRRAWSEAGETAYIKNPNSKWWDGYQVNILLTRVKLTLLSMNLEGVSMSPIYSHGLTGIQYKWRSKEELSLS